MGLAGNVLVAEYFTTEAMMTRIVNTYDTVSYTHLDVYKRQVWNRHWTLHSADRLPWILDYVPRVVRRQAASGSLLHAPIPTVPTTA